MSNQFQPRFWDKDNQLLGCSLCSSHKSYDSFHVDSSNKFGRAYYCKTCACNQGKHHYYKRKDDPEFRRYNRNRWIKEAHGLTLNEYTEKLIAQDSKCAICGVELPTSGHLTHLDHNHESGKLRDFLCTNCNRGLGHFQDSPELLAKAKAYLESHNTDVDCVKEDTHL